ncbi:MAG: hypothetical protein HYZ81_21450 [Nitrospinae bacterium]|nr:hypothetical protein [Nitrospinota bacterium]
MNPTQETIKTHTSKPQGSVKHGKCMGGICWLGRGGQLRLLSLIGTFGVLWLGTAPVRAAL